MNNTYTIKNEHLQISVKGCGAELCSIVKLASNKEYMWDGNPSVWGAHAPVLFPIVGVLKNGSFMYNGENYVLPKHGFFRKNPEVRLLEQNETSLCFGLKFSEAALKNYPFCFEFRITFSLVGNQIQTKHEVLNHGDATMYFSLGGHPAFKCPLNEGERYSDYYLEFEKAETAYNYPIDEQDLLLDQADLVLNQSRRIDLHYDLFNQGALVFKNLVSEHISLVSAKSGVHLKMSLKGFPYLGIWAKPHANFVCIEPWIGVNDSIHADQNIEHKEGIVALDPKKKYEASYEINIA